MRNFILLVAVLFHLAVAAQITNNTNTVGLLYTEPAKVSEGYLLFAPFEVNDVYLIDNCGFNVKKWTFEFPTIYSGCYLLEDGSVLKLNGDYDYENYYNSNACIERRSWDDELLWQYCQTVGEGYYHSDIHLLPNGNVLAILLEFVDIEEAILFGLNPNYIDNFFALETVVELKPLGIDSAEVVWKWRLLDHLVQDFDETKSNFGNIADNPRKYNINLYAGFNHYNSIDYNETLDQIVLSSWNDNEIYIIDHSTTTEEAATSSGGKYGFGGDFLFRWGSPENYDAEGKRRLLGQHNPRWIPAEYEQFGGMISIYNNLYYELEEQEQEEKSAVVIINPDPNGDGIYEMDGSSFLPETYDFVLPNKEVRGGNMFSEIMSGAVVQANGNIVTCEANRGRFMELDTAGNVVWQYQCPNGYYNVLNQGDEAYNGAYKIEKYTADYAGLLGRELCGTATIENENELSQSCKEFWMPSMAFLKTIDGAAVNFTTTATNFDALMWNFGDGDTSTVVNATHIYESTGEYEVCLTGTNCYGENTYCEKIEIDVTSINLIDADENILLANIVTNQLVFKNKAIEVKAIYAANGQLVNNINLSVFNNINVANLSNGIYFLIFKHPNQNTYSKAKFCKM